MPPASFEPAIPASEWPQTRALDGAATGMGQGYQRYVSFLVWFLGNYDFHYSFNERASCVHNNWSFGSLYYKAINVLRHEGQ
jgi:hypothetical protein